MVVCDHVRGQFAKDVASYHISGDPARVPAPGTLKDSELERVYVVDDDGRQIMHVTYGSAFTAKDASGRWLFRDRIFALLAKEEDLYTACLEKHLGALPELFKVSQVELSDAAEHQVKKADGNKCPRCWTYKPEVGKQELCNRCVEATT